MRKIRIGNDIQVSWEVKTGGEALSLEGRTLKLWVRSAYSKQEITEFSVSGCVITFEYPAEMQKTTGSRAVILEDVTENGSYRTICADEAFQLVAHSAEESCGCDAQDGEDFDRYMVSLRSNVLVGRPGMSAYEVWLSDGNTGTLADWYAYLQKPATDAASSLIASEDDRVKAEQLRAEAEAQRNNAETLRDEAEQARTTAESRRVSAEQARATQEQQRTETEIAREANELTRKANENERKDAESVRNTNEQMRQTSEQTRANTEAKRIEAEAARVKQEEARNTAEEKRDKAEQIRTSSEQTRTDKETQRQTSEAQRITNENEREEAEQSRNASESNREKAEQARQAAETKRASAEQAREKGYTDKVTEVNTAITNANTATTGAERVNAVMGDDDVLTITDREGEERTLNLVSQVKAEAMAEDTDRIKQTLGSYSAREDVVLTPTQTNVAISADGVKVNKSGWAIAEFTAELGNEYLFKPGVIDGSVCIFAEYVDKVETRAIDYQLTYDDAGRVQTAKATYNGKTYTYTYDYTAEVVVIRDQSGSEVQTLPSVYTTTVGSYSVLTRLNAGAELPEDGYCRFVSNFQSASAIKVVVSYKVGSADLTMKVVRDGMTASMCTQLSKINKKVDDVTASQKKKNSVLIMAKAEGVKVNIDGVVVDVPAKKRFYREGFVSCRVANGQDKINRMDANWDTSNMTGMYRLFCNCSSLTSLDVSGWDTSKVTVMSETFMGCSSLTRLDVSGFDTSNMTGMYRLFCNCSSLTSLDVSGFDTSKVTVMSETFMGCSSLTRLDVSGFDTSKVTQALRMFYGCSSLTSLDVSGFDTSKVTVTSDMFHGCSSLTTLTFGEGFGKMKDACGTLDLSGLSAWKNDSVKSLLNLYDRKANGMGVITIKLHANAKAVLGTSGIEQLTAKGYTIA